MNPIPRSESDEGDDVPQPADVAPEVHLPGLRPLREAVSRYGRRLFPSRKSLYTDSVAGLTVAVASVPEGMAGGVLAGVNPVYGLYANIIGPLAGTVICSTQLMVIQNTSAVSLVAGQSLAAAAPAEREAAMVLLVVLTGVFAAAAGALQLGRLTNFVSYSVMTGFLSGIAAVLILSQLPTLTGYSVEGVNRVTQTIDLFEKIEHVHLASLFVGIGTLALALGFQRTKIGHFSGLIAIAVPSLAVALFDIDGVAIVRDLGDIPRGIPEPQLPSFSRVFDAVTGAIACAVVLLVQGAGVSLSVPNPDGSERRASTDFLAQGIANVASGIFRGLPVGGSVSTTALNVMAGARRRWAAISSGLWLAMVVILAPGAVAQVAMPALGGLIILAGIHSINVSDIRTVWFAGWAPRIAAITTFTGMLVLPIQLAVALGVSVSALLHLSSASSDVSIVELRKRPDGAIEEREPPQALPGNAVTMLDVYGHLFFAGARTFERLLPRPSGEMHPAVILRLRGRRAVGATLIEVLSRYSAELDRVNGRLYLTGVSKGVNDALLRFEKVRSNGSVKVFEANTVRGNSTQAAYDDAQEWLEETTAAEPRSA